MSARRRLSVDGDGLVTKLEWRRGDGVESVPILHRNLRRRFASSNATSKSSSNSPSLKRNRSLALLPDLPQRDQRPRKTSGFEIPVDRLRLVLHRPIELTGAKRTLRGRRKSVARPSSCRSGRCVRLEVQGATVGGYKLSVLLRKAPPCSPFLPCGHPGSSSQRPGLRQPYLSHISADRSAVDM